MLIQIANLLLKLHLYIQSELADHHAEAAKRQRAAADAKAAKVDQVSAQYTEMHKRLIEREKAEHRANYLASQQRKSKARSIQAKQYRHADASRDASIAIATLTSITKKVSK